MQKKPAAPKIEEQHIQVFALLENSREFFGLADLDGTITYINRAGRKMCGFPSEGPLASLSVTDLFPKSFRTKFQKEIFPLVLSGDSWHGETFLQLLSDNTELPVDISVFIVFHSETKKQLHVAIVLQDISSFRQTEELDHYFTLSLDLLCITDTDGYFRRLNPQWEKTLGYSLSELKGKRFLDFVHPDDLQTTMNALAQLNKRQEVLNFVNRYRCKDGYYRLLEWRSYPNGILIYAIARDITDQKQVEESLRGSEERFRSIYENSTIGIYRTTSEGKIVLANPALIKLLGYSSFEELSLRNLEKEGFEPTYSRKQFLELIEKEGEIKGLESAWIHTDGTAIYVRENARAIRDKAGTILYYDGTVEDITERKQAEKLLQESEERMRAIIDHAPFGAHSYELQPDGRLNFMSGNNSADRILGFNHSTIIGKSIEEAFPGLVSTTVPEMYRRIAATGESRTIDQIEYDEGEVQGAFEVHAFQTAPNRMTVFFRDITERKRAEEALQKASAAWQTTFNATSDAICVLDKDQIVQQTNKAMSQLFPSYSGKMVGLHCWEIVHGTSKPIEECPILRMIKSCHRESMEICKGDRWLDVTVDPILDDSKNIMGAVHIIRDITERKLAEKALRESEEKFRSLAEQSPNMIFINRKGRVIYANAKCEEITGYSKEEFYAPDFDFFNITSPDFVSLVKDKFSMHQRGEEVSPYEYALIAKNGNKINTIISTKLIDYENEKAILGVITDISDRKRAEEEKEKLQDQLLQAQKMDAIGQLAGGIAHDFNNMIGVILGYATLIENQLDPSNPLTQKVKAIITAAERSANLTGQLLGFARKQIANPIVLNLNDELSTLQKMLQRLIGEDIDLCILPGHGLWNIKIDPVQVGQIITNMATNARHAIHNVGSITIGTLNITLDASFSDQKPEIVPGEYVLLTFSDTGKGMDRETQSHVFEPFYTTKPKGQGTGLGLATVFGIVKQNNGYIHIYSELDKGTTISIYFPRHYGEAEIPLTPQEEISLVGVETVLVVEDEEQLLDLTVSYLKKFGYTVIGAKSPREAITICQQSGQNIDLLVTDVIMPEMNGKELKTQIDLLKPDIKTIFMSGYTADIVAKRGILEEGVHFIQKPFKPRALAKKVREVFKK
jgi:two-component system cell cycle sensor histidine kinase/response regulator CckA